MTFMLLGIGVYVLAQLVIGYVVSRRIRTEEDYVLAGRSVGFTLATFSIFATWFGAETCMGSAGEIYQQGLSAGARDPFGYSLCLMLMGLLLAAPLRRRRLTTLGDIFRTRYSPGVERFAVLLMVPTSILWAAAQIRAFGQVLSASSQMTLEAGMLIAAAVVIVYTTMGGLLADVVTDLVQGLVLVVALVVIFFIVLDDAGGIGAATAAIEPERWRVFPAGVPVLETAEMWLVPICGSVVAQELVARVLACKTPTVARRACFAATALYVSVGMIPAFIGLIGPRLVPQLEDPERLLPEIARIHGGSFLFVLFAGALVSAILSTIDSCLLAASTLVTENLVASVRPGLSSRTRLRISRCGVVVSGVIVYLFARRADGILSLVEEASGFASSGIFVVVMFGLFTRFGGALSAAVALAAGAGTWIAGYYILGIAYPYLGSLATALLAYSLFATAGAGSPGARLSDGIDLGPSDVDRLGVR